MRARKWSWMGRLFDKRFQDAPVFGRHRKDVSSTHVPAWPFNQEASWRA